MDGGDGDSDDVAQVKRYTTLSQKDRFQMESDAVVLDSDLRTGDNVSIVKVIIIEDLKFRRDESP